MLLVVFLLVCKHPDKLPSNPIIPFRDFISEKSKNSEKSYISASFLWNALTGQKLFKINDVTKNEAGRLSQVQAIRAELKASFGSSLLSYPCR